MSILQVKLVTITKKVLKQLPVKWRVSQVEFNLYKVGWKVEGLVYDGPEPFILLTHKNEPKAVLIPFTQFMDSRVRELVGRDPWSLDRIVVV